MVRLLLSYTVPRDSLIFDFLEEESELSEYEGHKYYTFELTYDEAIENAQLISDIIPYYAPLENTLLLDINGEVIDLAYETQWYADDVIKEINRHRE